MINLIQHNAQELRALNAAIERTYQLRSRSKADWAAWSKACEAFHSNYDRLAFPGGLDRAYELLKQGDVGIIESVVAFLEEDPYFHRSGYVKADFLRTLAKFTLDGRQQARLRQIILARVRGAVRREFRRYCNLAPYVSTPVFQEEVAALLADPDPVTSRNAGWVLAALRRGVQSPVREQTGNRPEIWNGIRVPYDASLSDLERLAHGPPPARWAAFVALAHSGDDSALPLLQESTESSDYHVRRMAVESIGVHPGGARLADVIVTLLADSHPVVVRSACEAAGRQLVTQAHDAILRLLDSPDAATRRVAAATLRFLWQETDFDRVLQAFTSDPSSEVRREAAWTLRAVASPSTWHQLFETWETDALSRHRGWAAELAGAYGNEEFLPHLRRLATDMDGHVRDRAIEAIRAVKG